ncbi:MAG: zinc ribbon domain-containing protein [Oscillospiraceae bacterium]|jgi:uncharacterized OB-fold protein
MAFFDKLRDKTSEMLEISKLNNKINEEKSKIAAQKTALADLYWAKFESGEQLTDEAMACCNAIKASYEAIEELNQKIIKLKEEPPQAAAATAGTAQPNTEGVESASCTACGSQVLLGKKFCPECGTPIAPPEPAAKDEPMHCSSCGEVVSPGKKFCSECGAPIQEENEANQSNL